MTVTGLFFFVAAAGCNLLLTPLAIRLAPRVGLLDHPGSRKIHQNPMAKVGGITLVLSFLFSICLGLLLFGQDLQLGPDRTFKLYLMLAVTVLMALVGLVDDLYNLRPRNKLILQAIVLGVYTLVGFRFEALHIPGFSPVELSVLGIPFTLFWLLAIVNGFNFMDGLDGLAGTVSVVVFLGFGVAVRVVQGASATGVIWMAALGAILSFLLFNWRPAKVYLGDTGSSALGGLAAILLVGLGSPGPSLFYFLQPDQPVPEAVRFHFVAATLLAGYPALEVTLSAFRRGAKFLYFGRSMEWSEQEHIHHRLLKLGIKPGAICLTACLCQVLFSSAGVLIMVKQNALATWLMVPFLMGFAYAAPRLGIVRFLGIDQATDKPYYRIAHNFIAFQRSKLALARSREQILALVSQTCREFGVRCFRFKIQPDAGGKGGMDYLFRVPETRMDARDLHLMDNPADGEKGWYFDYYEIPGRRDEAFWLFDHHAGDDELDVEYRVLMSGFMREALQFAVILGEGLETLDLPSVMTLPHDEMSGHRLRQRDRSKFN